ncbi:MAG: hypothetical protein DRP85_03270 [Candidatus Makaraimicrobium thalassicum]|nr:MAG: hypothetical protein DRP85_03270 [Candidatus Omnitrophota bacterium]
MSGGLSGSKNKSKSSSQYQDEVWGGQSPYLGDLYQGAGNLFDWSNQGMQGNAPDASQRADDIYDTTKPAWEQQLGGGAYQDMGLQKSLMDSIRQSNNNPSAMSEINAMMMGGEGNNYADAMKSQYMDDANKAQEQMMGNLDARATASGMSGGSRHGITTAQGMDDINSNLQRNMAETGYNTFDKDLDRKLQIAGMADQGTLSRQNMMMEMLGKQNQTTGNAMGYGSNMQNLGMGSMNPYMSPWNAMGQYANVIGRPTILGSGDSRGSSSGRSFSASGGKF